MPELAGSREFVRVLSYSMKGLAPPRWHPIVSVVSLVNAVSRQSWPTILLILRFQARIFRISPSGSAEWPGGDPGNWPELALAPLFSRLLV